jgi:biopolymer transport protein ExbD/biopolymer transport protein TolR
MHALSELNVTPLLDLCFCLLIIFMIATPVLEQTTQIDLPVATKIPTPPSQSKISPRSIALDRNGQLIFDGKVTFESELRNQLKGLAAKPEAEQPVIRVRIDGSLPSQRLMDLFSLAYECGLSKVSIDTEIKD